jgi:NAD-dependent deacetylase
VSSDSELRQAAEAIRRAEKIVVFSGAGISVESGVAAFRAGGSLWKEFPPEQFATRHGLVRTAKRDPNRFWRFLCAIIGPIADARPNAAHRAIVELERHAQVTVVTQNIDGLHQDAGSKVVHEVHGSLLETRPRGSRSPNRRLTRRQLQSIARALRRAPRLLRLPWSLAAIRPLAGPGLRGIHLPNLVLFGESLAEPAWSEAMEAARGCDVLLVIGCSLEVWPAAFLPIDAKVNGATVIAIDPEFRPGDIWLKGPAAEITPRLLEAAFGDGKPPAT